MIAQQLVNGLFLGAVYALFAVGYTLIFGVLDILNLAHAAVFMAAAFVAFSMAAQGLPLGLDFAVAVIFAGVLGALVIRKPGAAIFTELVAASVSALIGTQWGGLTLLSGLVQGLGVEIVFALFLYANWRLYAALIGDDTGPETLVQAAALHPNWMTNAETVVSPGMNAMMKGAFKALGWKGPFWKHLPSVFRLANRFGVRQRGLQAHQANMRKVTDVKHYRG